MAYQKIIRYDDRQTDRLRSNTHGCELTTIIYLFQQILKSMIKKQEAKTYIPIGNNFIF